MKRLLELFTTRCGVSCLGLTLVAGALACTDDTGDDMGDEMGDDTGDTMGDGDGDTGAPLSHAADIQPIWDTSCVAACHEPGGAGAILDLTDGYAALVGVNSTQAVGVSLVAPGDSANSYLVDKLRNTQLDAGGSGASMPFGLDPLPDATIMLIEEWIDEGAME